LETGARREEILRIRYSDVDFRTRTIHLAKTKNGKNRYVPISDSFASYLSLIPQSIHTEYLFACPDGKPYHDVRIGF
jgi:integrase